ncbi:PREDICTED: uncharacterized protein LOC105966756 [Erythranthe guttata]|uniref:uncharacterized protein LOC105966756 n=1 Tax=Erythranthe guttata TaxID=4155 RepID=UPI00064DAC03|nr:PREDICTED: uncharacterized protein LOC105966756 [Erythranthe guttata]|eukprot:XP_012846789.1 PREDICTED: uncharacterized protein LOC105966756 [Erythranthe guttata]
MRRRAMLVPRILGLICLVGFASGAAVLPPDEGCRHFPSSPVPPPPSPPFDFRRPPLSIIVPACSRKVVERLGFRKEFNFNSEIKSLVFYLPHTAKESPIVLLFPVAVGSGMTSSIVLLFRYGEFCSITDFTRGMSFSNLVHFVCSRWNSLSVDNLSLSYSVPEIGVFSINDDEDVKGLFIIVEQWSIQRIEIVVKQVHASIGTSDTSYSSMVGSSSVLPVAAIEAAVNPPCNTLRSIAPRKTLLSSHWINLITDVGQVFRGGRSEFRICLAKFAYELGFGFDFIKNDTKRVTAVCKLRQEKNCLWRIHATVQPSTEYCIIRTYEKHHTCESAFSAVKKVKMCVKLVADLIVEDIRNKPLLCANDVIHDAKKNYGIDIDYNTAWRAMESSRSFVFGDDGISYSYLKVYFEEAGRCNPDSVFHLEVDEKHNSFDRCFFSFGACLSGFKFCRPILFLDGTFLKGRCKGILLSAMAKDARNGLYPVAFAVVREENDSNWNYFMEHLKCCISSDRVLTFVSDRQHGILEAVKNIFPNCYHAFCLLHLENNLRYKLSGMSSSYRDVLVSQLIACAYAPTKEIFHEKLQKFKIDGSWKVVDFLSDLPFKNWANAYFEGHRYGEMYSNAVESWNGTIKKFRHLPITHMIDSIKGYMMDKICERSAEASGWTTMLCPKMEMILSSFVEDGRTWTIRKSNQFVFEVHSDSHEIVDLFARTCTCRDWQLKGFPCCHVAVVLKNIPVGERYGYIDPLFYACNFRSTYSFSIYPFMVDFTKVEQPPVGPPVCQTRRGRPKKNRIPSRGENIKKKIKCGRCKEIGHHNKKTCNKAI